MHFIKVKTYKQYAFLNLDNVDYVVEDDEDTSALLVYFNGNNDPLPVQSSLSAFENNIVDAID